MVELTFELVSQKKSSKSNRLSTASYAAAAPVKYHIQIPTMSAPSTPSDSPAPIQPMHNPSQAAHIVLPQAPLGNATNGAVSGLGAKALLAKRMAKSNNPKFVSPTDDLLTPVTKKLNAAKQKHFVKGVKPIGDLFGSRERSSEERSSESDAESTDSLELSDAKTSVPSTAPIDEDENPF